MYYHLLIHHHKYGEDIWILSTDEPVENNTLLATKRQLKNQLEIDFNPCDITQDLELRINVDPIKLDINA